MTRSSPPDWSSPAASARRHSEGCRAGGKKAFRHFRELVSELLCVTIAHPEASVWMPKPKAGRPTRSDLFGGHGPGDSLVRLNNDAYLRLIVSLFLEHDGPDRHLRAGMCTYQYQFDPDGDERVFRYEYGRDRDAGDNRPMGHLHVRGDLRTDCLPAKGTLERVHFACGRPTIEGVIAVLADEFGVPTHAPRERVATAAPRDRAGIPARRSPNHDLTGRVQNADGGRKRAQPVGTSETAESTIAGQASYRQR